MLQIFSASRWGTFFSNYATLRPIIRKAPSLKLNNLFQSRGYALAHTLREETPVLN